MLRSACPGELLDGLRRRPSHREMRAERVPQVVNTVLRELRSTRRAQHAVLHHLSSQRLAIVLAQHVGTPQMPMIAERGRQSDDERHIPEPSALRYVPLIIRLAAA